MNESHTDTGSPPANNKWLLAGLAAGLAVVVYTGVWLYLTTVARDAALAWAEARRAEGYVVRFDAMRETGYPLSIRLEITRPGLGAPHSSTPWGWEAERLEISLTPWNWAAVSLKTSGQQMLSFTMPGPRRATYTGTAGVVSAALGAAGLDIYISELSLNGDTPDLGGLAIARGQIHAARPDADGAALDIRLSEMRLPRLLSSPLGDGVRELVLKARLQGDFPPGPLPDSLEAWRDDGGTIKVSRLAVRHGPMALKADGTLALDGALQPIGAFTARIEGFFDTIDALQQTGMVTPRDAITAKMILGVMSRRPENGGPATLNLALTLQDRKLFAGPVGLMKFAEVDWRRFGRIE
ncbi:MAG: DUF2125 domain-containing protein [Alphaproteobacteria bacterium]